MEHFAWAIHDQIFWPLFASHISSQGSFSPLYPIAYNTYLCKKTV